MDGIITDIHRASVVDGPGIRTAVFLKGCPLSCIWCHNPETRSRNIELAVKNEKCDTCADCLPHCPLGALDVVDGQITVDHTLCDNCLACVETCPTEAIFSYGRTVTVDEILGEVRKDVAYYRDSGGGVTVSGGEPMMQPDFTLELLRRCKAQGIHTCLDTTGIGPAEAFRASLGHVDLYLFDYKASDAELHQRLTGAPLPAVLKTFEMLMSAGAKVRLRCPLVPGVNDDEAHLRRIAELSRSHPQLDGIDLLCWHTMGLAKYKYLGQPVSDQLPKENTSESTKAGYRELMQRAGAVGVEVH